MTLEAEDKISIFYSGTSEELDSELNEARKRFLAELGKDTGLKLLPMPSQADIVRHDLKFIDKTGIDDSDAYVFVGKPGPIDLYLLKYWIDRAQSNLPDAMVKGPDGKPLQGPGGKVYHKPIVIINEHGEYDELLKRADDLELHGGAKVQVSKKPIIDNIVKVVHSAEEAHQLLKEKNYNPTKLFELKHTPHKKIPGALPRGKPQVFVCCGFSLESGYVEETARKLGRLMAPDFDIITGGGRGGIMKAFQKAAFDAGAHVLGVTFPQLNTLATEAEGMGSEDFGISFVQKADSMNDRIIKMTDPSKAMLILPGGWGTDTECLAPLLRNTLKQIKEKKPVVIMNLMNPDRGGKRYHDSLIKLLESVGFSQERGDFTVVNPPLIYHDAQGHERVVSNEHEIKPGMTLDMEASSARAAEETSKLFEPVKSTAAGRVTRSRASRTPRTK